MNSILAYVIILSVLSVNAIYDNLPFNPVIPMDAPYNFVYNSTHDIISMTLFFDNNFSSAMEINSVEHRRSGLITGSIHKKKWEIKARQKYYYNYRLKLEYEQIIWQFLSPKNASCFDPITIFEGIAIDRNISGQRHKYDNRCLRTEPCLVHLYLQDKCLDATSVTAEKPQKGMKEIMKTTTVTPSVTHLNSYNTFKSETPTTIQEDIESTTSNISKANAETSILAVVMSSLFSIVFIVLVIIMIWICCIKQSPQGKLGVQTNHTQPFYVNMLFRRECDQEIAEIEQHHYEEIVPGVAEGN